jgi:hypothetical protein
MTGPDFGSTPSPAPAAKASVFEDFVDIFYAPSAVYERRRDASPWLPIIVVGLVIGVGYLASSGAMQPMMDAEFDRGMKAALERNPEMTQEMMEQGRAIGEMGAKVGAFLGAPFAIAFTGLVLHLVSRLFDATQVMRASILIAAYAFVPRMLQAILLPVQLQFANPENLDGMYRLSIGPARFLDPDTASALMVAVAGRFDFFILWTTALLAIGLAVIGRVPRAQAWMAAAMVWVVGAVPALWGAMNAAGA